MEYMTNEYVRFFLIVLSHRGNNKQLCKSRYREKTGILTMDFKVIDDSDFRIWYR